MKLNPSGRFPQKSIFWPTLGLTLVLAQGISAQCAWAISEHGESTVTLESGATLGYDRMLDFPFLDSIYSDYNEVLNLLAAKTTSPINRIDQDLRELAKRTPPPLTSGNLSLILSHIYLVKERVPCSNWSTELENIRTLLRSLFRPWAGELFIDAYPPKLIQHHDGRLQPTEDISSPFQGSFKRVYPIRLFNSSTQDDRIWALAIPRDEPTEDSPSEEKRQEFIQESLETFGDEARIIRKIVSLSGGKPVSGIPYFAHIQTSDALHFNYFLTPFANRGHAAGWVNHPDELRTSNELLDLAQDLISGLNFLHSNGIIHRDIKPGNILVHRDLSTGQISGTLSDFGTSYTKDDLIALEKLKRETQAYTTWRYVAPEIIEQAMLQRYLPDTSKIRNKWITWHRVLNLSPDIGLRWNHESPRSETDRTGDLWSLGASLLEIASNTQLNAGHWIQIAEILPRKTKLAETDFLRVTQPSVDRVLAQLDQILVGHPELTGLRLAIGCLLRVNASERCSLTRAAELLESSRKNGLAQIQVLPAPGVSGVLARQLGSATLAYRFKTPQIMAGFPSLMWSEPGRVAMSAVGAFYFCSQTASRLATEKDYHSLMVTLGGRPFSLPADELWKPAGYNPTSFPILFKSFPSFHGPFAELSPHPIFWVAPSVDTQKAEAEPHVNLFKKFDLIKGTIEPIETTAELKAPHSVMCVRTIGP